MTLGAIASVAGSYISSSPSLATRGAAGGRAGAVADAEDDEMREEEDDDDVAVLVVVALFWRLSMKRLAPADNAKLRLFWLSSVEPATNPVE